MEDLKRSEQANNREQRNKKEDATKHQIESAAVRRLRSTDSYRNREDTSDHLGSKPHLRSSLSISMNNHCPDRDVFEEFIESIENSNVARVVLSQLFLALQELFLNISFVCKLKSVWGCWKPRSNAN